MYRIIGADGTEYGPVSGDQIRQWLAEGRLNSQSLARPDTGGNFAPLSSYAEFGAFAAPPPFQQPPAPTTNDGTLGGLIPKNSKALVSYYLGIFSLIPCLAIPMGITAIVFGVMGLKYADQNPQAKGKAHAWTGIICGGLFVLLNLIVIVLFIVGAGRRSDELRWLFGWK